MNLKDVTFDQWILAIFAFFAIFAVFSKVLGAVWPATANVRPGLLFLYMAIGLILIFVYQIIFKKFQLDKPGFVVAIIVLVVLGGLIYLILQANPNILGGMFSVWDVKTMGADWDKVTGTLQSIVG